MKTKGKTSWVVYFLVSNLRGMYWPLVWGHTHQVFFVLTSAFMYAQIVSILCPWEAAGMIFSRC